MSTLAKGSVHVNGDDGPLETWRYVWRKGILPNVTPAGLLALSRALAVDSRELIQHATTFPAGFCDTQDLPIEKACPLGYIAWRGESLNTVGEVESAFGRLCAKCDEAIGEPAAARYFLNHVDEISREQLRRDLLPEIQLALQALSPTKPAA